ncbi:HAD-IIIC family phosphatase [uncultured Methylobacterium sp.]|uniref:HAD-IIIC family phosphatase n=1 Tax=uncultured Methylobacterium sp. TaxID=157278 RepID=UPI0035CBC2C4
MLYESRPQNPAPDVDPDDFDLILVAPTLRCILNEVTAGPQTAGDMTFARLSSVEEKDALLDRCSDILRLEVGKFHAKFPSKPIFFMSLLEPSFNFLGGVVGRFDPCAQHNIIRQMNERLCQFLESTPDAYYFDLNECFNSVGRAHLQDDISYGGAHAALISDWDLALDQDRLQPPSSRSATFRTASNLPVLATVIWRQVTDNYRVVRQKNAIKLIVVDLDDTLWRGVAAEEAYEHWRRVEGWPTGFVEALLWFKRRGGLLAICSKNEREATLQRLFQIWNGALREDDFVAMEISWDRKSEGVAAILKQVNLLPQSVLFIDDNPREIDEVVARFPDMRTLSADNYDWRRILLRSPETQVSTLTPESQRRTEMTRAILDRSLTATEMPRDEWLRSLSLKQNVRLASTSNLIEFERAFELINKTNQFNTTGKRWDRGELSQFLSEGGLCFVASVKDKTVDNGIVSVALIKGAEIVQVVLSCRVFALGIEIAMGSIITDVALRAGPVSYGVIVKTGKNLACHKFFESIGFAAVGDRFETSTSCEPPEWIELSVSIPEVAT